jgi:hypothetical protein
MGNMKIKILMLVVTVILGLTNTAGQSRLVVTVILGLTNTAGQSIVYQTRNIPGVACENL